MYNNNFDWANDTNRGISLTAIETYCRLARLRYAGHIARMSKSRIPNIVLHGEVGEGFRRPGRPKKSFREGLRNNDLKAFQLWPKYIAQKKLIDWSKTEKNGEKQLTQLRKKSRNNGNKQRLIQAMKENKRKSRNVIVFTDHFFMIIIIIIKNFYLFIYFLQLCCHIQPIASNWLHGLTVTEGEGLIVFCAFPILSFEKAL